MTNELQLIDTHHRGIKKVSHNETVNLQYGCGQYSIRSEG